MPTKKRKFVTSRNTRGRWKVLCRLCDRVPLLSCIKIILNTDGLLLWVPGMFSSSCELQKDFYRAAPCEKQPDCWARSEEKERKADQALPIITYVTLGRSSNPLGINDISITWSIFIRCFLGSLFVLKFHLPSLVSTLISKISCPVLCLLPNKSSSNLFHGILQTYLFCFSINYSVPWISSWERGRENWKDVSVCSLLWMVRPLEHNKNPFRCISSITNLFWQSFRVEHNFDDAKMFVVIIISGSWEWQMIL